MTERYPTLCVRIILANKGPEKIIIFVFLLLLMEFQMFTAAQELLGILKPVQLPVDVCSVRQNVLTRELASPLGQISSTQQPRPRG